MFTGFASENTPAIQVHDFFRTFASTSAVRSVSLPDDCAPIQVFRTGGATTAIPVYLPTAPIEGKQITIVNQQYGSSTQSIGIFSSDTSGNGATFAIFTLGQGDSIVLVYSKQNITFGTSTGLVQSGWISLNKSSPTSANYYAAIVGGNLNSNTAPYGFIGGGESNSTGSSYSAVVGGSSNNATGFNSVVIGGSSNSASNTNSAVVGGNANTATGDRAAVVGSHSSLANATNATVFGGRYGSTRTINGNTVFPANVTPLGFDIGVSQSATLLLARSTTDATATRLTSTNAGAGSTNQVILPNNSAYTFQGTCIAARTAAGDTSSWKFEGAIKRGANAASTVLVAAVTPTVIAQDVGAVTWVLAITADTTNGGIAVTVTGAAATTIRWVAQIETTEVTF